MDQRSATLLEFPAIKARLAAATSFPPSRRLADALEPTADPDIVARGLDETDQARALVEDRPGVGIGAAHDIGPAVERAARGGRLDPSQFLEIATTLDATARLATFLADERRRLDALVGAELGSALQEPIITLRNGRYVVPVKAEARSRVKGIVHDASGSGQTLFIEPLVAVELGNAWREAQAAEQEEVARILDELSALIAVNAAALRETLDALARFDLWAAKASLAAELDAIRAE